jgi:hypothetical protein
MTVPASAKSDGADPTHRSRMTFTAFRGSGPVRRFRPRDACTACHGLIVDPWPPVSPAARRYGVVGVNLSAIRR